MNTIKIPLKLGVLLLTTKKQFLLYNLDEDKKEMTQYRLTNDYELTGNNRAFNNYKVISCIKSELLKIKH